MISYIINITTTIIGIVVYLLLFVLFFSFLINCDPSLIVLI